MTKTTTIIAIMGSLTLASAITAHAQTPSTPALPTLTGLHKGVPLNPIATRMAREAILRKYQEKGRLNSPDVLRAVRSTRSIKR